MNKSNIWIEALYEFKRARRSILFRLFLVLAICGLIFYQFTSLGSSAASGSVKYVLQFAPEWTSLALSSAIPFKSAYYFNIIQLLFIVCFVVNDWRMLNVGTRDALYVRSQGNNEMATGYALGLLLVFILLNWFLFLTSIIFNIALYPGSFNLFYYLFYWITLTLPASVYFLGFSCLVIRVIRNPGISLIVSFLLLGGITFLGAGFLHGVLDPCARYLPNMFSDFTGHVNPGNYLLQRGSILLTGGSFAVFSIIPYPRIFNYAQTRRVCLSVACILLVFAAEGAFIYLSRYGKKEELREVYKGVYEKYERDSKIRVVSNDLYVKELADGGISVNSRMTVENRTSGEVPLIMYLNPGLKVASIKVEGQPVSFRREHQAVLVDEKLVPGDSLEVLIDYEGNIENAFCYLDVSSDEYYSPDVNAGGIFRHGNTSAFCEKEYKLLPQKCLWYPVGLPPYGALGGMDLNFTRYSLRVEHDPALTAIAQGETIEEGKGVTSFRFTHDIPGISLCIGNYKKRTITITQDLQFDTTRLTLYYHPRHEYLLERYDFPDEEIAVKLLDMKGVLEMEEGLGFDEKFTEEDWAMVYRLKDSSRDLKEAFEIVLERKGFDPTRHYPYRWFTLLEVPCGYHVFPDLMQLTGEREQAGLVFLPEKLHSVKSYRHEVPKGEVEKEGVMRMFRYETFDPIFGKGSCNIRSAFRGKTTFISSAEIPLINEAINYALFRCQRSIVYFEENNFDVIEYLKHGSLKDALFDRSLPPGVLRGIIQKKSEELCMSIMLNVESHLFLKFHHDFLKKNSFKEVAWEEYCQQFYQSFGLRLDSLAERWYGSNRLPLFDIRDARAIKFGEKNTDVVFCFKVFNRGDVSGLIATSDFQVWTIPPHEGRMITARDRGRIWNFYCIEAPLAQNLPASWKLSLETDVRGWVDTATCVVRVDSSVFFQNRNEDEIIVDNEDPGFRVVKSKDFNLLSLLRKDEGRLEYDTKYSRQTTWTPVINGGFYGYSIRSAYVKQAGTGKQKVEWSTELPREGKYEVFFHHAKPTYIDMDRKQEFYYSIFDGSGEHEVVAFVNGDDVGWISLGVFDFTKEARVTLSDRDRKEQIKRNDRVISQELTADAVKWVWLKE
ncbi:MAG TPA: hypothetical protein K8V05_09330 [Butyricimonas virosa]|uniref:Golvesin/Xly CBD-like domain-containing protein n=1 Tax=Butyricimonas virosa TaxID=544645 RepID=A0A921KYP9_9BACT|nr:hypothetical protein [Butyricimonas virosa]